MDDTHPSMRNLFLQLGLPADEASIDGFIRDHQLPNDVRATDAPFWSEAQHHFLAEQFVADAPWAIVVDELNEALHKDAMTAAG